MQAEGTREKDCSSGTEATVSPASHGWAEMWAEVAAEAPRDLKRLWLVVGTLNQGQGAQTLATLTGESMEDFEQGIMQGVHGGVQGRQDAGWEATEEEEGGGGGGGR